MCRIRKKDFNYCSSKKYDGMMGRCYRESDRSYKHYGGRGIKICSEWIEDIDNFRDWLKKELFEQEITAEEFIKNSKVYQLDRKDTDGHYTPANCRISSPQKNNRNRRSTAGKKIVSAEGKEYTF